MRLFSTEQVSMYHPDKYADQISDAILDACLEQDSHSRVACECMVKGNTVILCGEITTKAVVDYAEVARRVASKLGYTVDTVIQQICTQSPEIAGGVKSGAEQGAGDQGIMFGYACNDTPSFLPYGFHLANRIIALLEACIRTDCVLTGDAKCQVTVDLDRPADESSVVEILVSACHSSKYSLDYVRAYITDVLRTLIDVSRIRLTINPAGSWTVGGPAADCGLTGRKIVCDQYGGYCAVGGGAFSGKDPSKVDRSAAYMARHIAVDIIKYHTDINECSVQLAYAIGKATPMSIVVSCDKPERNEKLSDWVRNTYDLTPAGIIKFLNLLDTKYELLAEGCHYRAGTIMDV